MINYRNNIGRICPPNNIYDTFKTDRIVADESVQFGYAQHKKNHNTLIQTYSVYLLINIIHQIVITPLFIGR